MKIPKTVSVMLCAGLLVTALGGCKADRDGPAERAGEAIDDAVDDAKDAVD
jgi:hypothetical protein